MNWHGAGPEADEYWQKYEQLRGRHYKEALFGHAARNTFDFDHRNIKRCDAGVLVLPAGKSGHLELGYMIGIGKRGYVLFQEEPERWDVMYQFAHGVFFDEDELIESLGRTTHEPV
jgi:nucleoside 2-deoxyribosyltransferase